VIILTVKTIKGTGIVKNGQIFIPVLRPAGDGILRVTAPLTAGAYKIRYTICWEWVIVVREVSFMRPPPPESARFNAAKTAKTSASLRYPAPMNAQTAGYAIRRSGRINGKAVCSTALIMNSLYLRPDFIKMCPDTIGTEADHLRDSPGNTAAMPASPHGKFLLVNSSAVIFSISECSIYLPPVYELSLFSAKQLNKNN